MKLVLLLAFALTACGGSKQPAVEEPITPSAEPPPSGAADPMAPGNGVCPVVQLSEAGHTAKGTPLTVSASVGAGAPDVTPTYNWSVSAGGIETGQGTDKIVVRTADVDGNLTVTVEVGGFAPECRTSASTTTHVM